MLTNDDLIQLDCPPELTAAGIDYTTQKLAHAAGDAGAEDFDHLRAAAAGAAAELAFRRLLNLRQVPLHHVEPAGFEPARQAGIAIGGRRCILSSQLITHKKEIQRLHGDPGIMLGYPAGEPSARPLPGYQREDLLIFALMTGLVSRGRQGLEKAVQAGERYYLFARLPAEWYAPRAWTGLGELALKSDCSQPVKLTVAGLDKRRALLSRQSMLPRRTRLTLPGDFYSLGFLHIDPLPDGAVGVHSPALGKTHLVSAYQWGNLWVYDLRIFLCGWLSVEEYQRQVKPGAAALRSSLRLGDLRPLEKLFGRARDWGG